MTEEKTRIMIIDDEKFFREFVVKNLSEEFEVLAVDGGDETFSVIKEYDPALILLDRVMPGMGGDEVCRKLKGDKETVAIPVIMITSLGEKDDIISGLEAGADDYVAKPIYLPELLAKIRSCLRTRNLYGAFEKDDLLNVLDVYETLTTFHSSHDILASITKKLASVLSAVRCSVVRVDEGSNRACVLASSEDERIKDMEIDLGNYPEINMAAELKKEIIIDDLRSDPVTEDVRDKVKGLPFRSLALLPISIRDRFIGTMFLRVATKKERLTEKDMRLCEVVARAAASVLENTNLMESLRLANIELEKLATTDDLTKIYNHRYFYNRLDEEFNIAKRYNVSLACIMLDIDYFKDINDTYGHRQGDRILKELATVMTRTVRKTDVVARYGGEEFVILLPHTDEKGALFQAERIRKAVRAYKFPGLPEDKRMTISLGIATCLNMAVCKAEDLVKFADAALYNAKSRGRDNSVLYQSS